MHIHGFLKLAHTFLCCCMAAYEPTRTVLIVGSTGVGKSTLVNMLFNNDSSVESCQRPCPVKNTSLSVTQSAAMVASLSAGRMWMLCDTVGLGITSEWTEHVVLANLHSLFDKLTSGVTCVIWVARFDRVTREERANIRTLLELFSPDCMQRQFLLVLTRYSGADDDGAKQRAYDAWLEGDVEMRDIVSRFRKTVLTDNDVGRNADRAQGLRARCLAECNAHIEACASRIPLAPMSFLDFAYHYMSFAGVVLARDAILSRKRRPVPLAVLPCCSCTQPITDFQDFALLKCGHPFHVACHKSHVRSLQGGRRRCQECRADVGDYMVYNPQ